MRFLSLFSGIGGLDLGLERAGMTCVGQVEIDPFCRKVLAKHWPDVWRHDDVSTIDYSDTPTFDAVAAGFPCQGISNAGKRAGLSDSRSGLFWEVVRCLRVARPRIAILENVAALLIRGMDVVCGTLAEIGYDAEWDCIPASAVGACHIRDRVFIVANNQGQSVFQLPEAPLDSNSSGIGQSGPWQHVKPFSHEASPYREASGFFDAFQEGTLPYVCRRHDGFSASMDRMKSIGNAVVPQVAEVIGRAVMASQLNTKGNP